MFSQNSLLRLFWSPLSLADAASCCSTRAAAVFGIAILLLEIGFVLSAQSGALAEPFPGFENYLAGNVYTALFLALMAAPFCASLVGCLVAVNSNGKSLWRYVVKKVSEARARVFLLGHVPLFLPILVWSFAASCVAALPADIEFYRPEGKPGWIASPILLLLSHPSWLWFWGSMVVVFWAFAITHMNAHHALANSQD